MSSATHSCDSSPPSDCHPAAEYRTEDEYGRVSDELQNLVPRTIEPFIEADRRHGEPSINHHDRVTIFVVRELRQVRWGAIWELADTTWDLYLVHWDEAKQLLFIHSSNKGSVHEGLAKAMAGDDVVLVRGEVMFRCFHEVRRLMLVNLGLKDIVSRSRQYTMFVGTDAVLTAASGRRFRLRQSETFSLVRRRTTNLSQLLDNFSG